jgi:hypothetical protein
MDIGRPVTKRPKSSLTFGLWISQDLMTKINDLQAKGVDIPNLVRFIINDALNDESLLRKFNKLKKS